MALAKEPVQAYSHYNNMHEEPSIQASDHLIDTAGFESYQKMVGEEVDGSEELDGPMKNFSSSHFPSLANLNSTNFVFRTSNSPSDKWDSTNGSLLSFDRGEWISHSTNYSKIGHEEDYLSWASEMDNKYGCNYTNSKCSRPMEDMNYETTSNNSLMKNLKDNQCSDERYGWLYSEDGIQDSGVSQGCFQKRPHMGGEVQAVKKHCAAGETRKSKAKTIPSKDPQSMAAKQRRERISERLKILQDLVPNGSKADLVTMLEKAISYVKFLQLQVKVLATDEFWPAQGGKAPEVAQVKEAIDAIISSYRDRSSSSK